MDSSPSRSPAPVPSGGTSDSDANLRWGILRRALLARSSSSRAPEGTSNEQQDKDHSNISRKASRGFNLLECQSLPISQLTNSIGNSVNGNDLECQKDVYVRYKLPGEGSSNLNLVFRREDSLELKEIETSNRYDIDTTGLVCCWPSEEVLAYYCINHSDIFRSKKVLELGSGYGLAGLTIAARTNADEISRRTYSLILNLLVKHKLNL